MLIYSTTNSDKISIAEQVKAVIAGGCRWIQLSTDTMTDSEASSAAETIIPLCRDNDVILVIDRYVDVVERLRVHGVHLLNGGMSPSETREKLGPHAIIGVNVSSAAEIIALKGKDIDYVTIGSYPNDIDERRLREIVDEIHAARVKMPVVPYGNIGIAELNGLIAAGASGIMVSHEIADASSPEEETRRYLAALTR